MIFEVLFNIIFNFQYNIQALETFLVISMSTHMFLIYIMKNLSPFWFGPFMIFLYIHSAPTASSKNYNIVNQLFEYYYFHGKTNWNVWTNTSLVIHIFCIVWEAAFLITVHFYWPCHNLNICLFLNALCIYTTYRYSE